MTLHRYNPRRDANEAGIVMALRQAGALVYRVSSSGLPDLLVGFRRTWFVIEVKTARGQLRPAQRTFFLAAEKMELPVQVVRSAEEALRTIGATA